MEVLLKVDQLLSLGVLSKTHISLFKAFQTKAIQMKRKKMMQHLTTKRKNNWKTIKQYPSSQNTTYIWNSTQAVRTVLTIGKCIQLLTVDNTCYSLLVKTTCYIYGNYPPTLIYCYTNYSVHLQLSKHYLFILSWLQDSLMGCLLSISIHKSTISGSWSLSRRKLRMGSIIYLTCKYLTCRTKQLSVMIVLL